MLAIVIPYYKPEFFDSCLSSLAEQENKDFRVYIGDDCSPQDPSEIINKYKEQISLTYHRFDQNIGSGTLTSHWERCIEMTNKEEWLMILCDDDRLSPQVVSEFYNQLGKIRIIGAKVVKYASQVIDTHGEAISGIYEHPRLQNYDEMFYRRFINNSRSSLSEHIFSREQYLKFGFRDLEYAWHADDFAWLDFSEFGCIYSINEAKVYFRISDINISRPDYLIEEKREMTYNFLSEVIREYLSRFKKEYSRAVLKKYEILSYDLKKNSFSLALRLSPFFLKYFGGIEMIKFWRRILINRFK